MSKTKNSPIWGEVISSCALKDGNTMYAYKNGNMIYFVVDDKVEKSFHIDDAAEILGALMGMHDESGV